MRVVRLWRYPVKSMGGESLDRVDVGPDGVDGDRRWGVLDDETGRVLTARREPRLLLASARHLGPGRVVIILPDGTETDDGADLAAWLDRDVSLVAAGTEGGVYENPLDAERDADWMSWQGPGGAWHDSGEARITLVSTTTLGSWDERRFRANVILDGDGEDRLVGGRVHVGDAALDVTKRVSRCVMVTRPQPGLERDLDVLRTVNRERGGCLAIGATVARPGRIAVGDEIVDRR